MSQSTIIACLFCISCHPRPSQGASSLLFCPNWFSYSRLCGSLVLSLSHVIIEQGEWRHSSLLNMQKGVVHGYTISQDSSCNQSRIDLITGFVEPVNRSDTFGTCLSTGVSCGQSCASHHLPATT